MTPKAPTSKPNRGKLKITQDRVVGIICFAIETDGVEKAKILFDMLNTYFSTEPGWPETALEVRKLFAGLREQEEQERQEEKEAERRLKELKATTPNAVVYNSNEAKAIGSAEIDKMDVDVNSPGNNIARIIQLGKDDDK